MVATLSGRRLELVLGDITRERVDAVVTAANRLVCGGNQAGFGGGVDGAIHRAAGPELLDECLALGGCAPGDAVITSAGKLDAKHIIHAVGPIYGDHRGSEDLLLASAHLRSLELAESHGCESVAFPAISCGVYKFPVDRAAAIAMGTIVDYLENARVLRKVRYCLFCEGDYEAFATELEALARDDHRVAL
ncbi:MAG: macro domain-containing protein [Gemmatimonadales bacterium]|nr:macro domain-containing protein [Gemmatimonadales bacterium]